MTKLVQQELQQVWKFENALRAARKNGEPEETIRELMDEIDLIRSKTDSERLRRQCAAILAEGNATETAAGITLA